MSLVLDFKDYQIQVHASDLAELSQRLFRLARDARDLSELQPDFSERLEDIQNELSSISFRLRRIN